MNAPRTLSAPEGGKMTVAPAEPFQLDPAEYPWLQQAEIEVPVVAVTLLDGTQFRYGSLIGFSKPVERIANNVSESESAGAQEHLFMALPSVLKGERHPGVGKLESRKPQGRTLLSANRDIARAVRLIFAVEQPDDASVPVVLRAGISVPRDRDRLVRAFGLDPNHSSHFRKKLRGA